MLSSAEAGHGSTRGLGRATHLLAELLTEQARQGVLEAIAFEEQEQRLKYNQLVANAVAIQNVIDLTRAVRALLQEGYPVRHEELAALSPYQTGHLKRFGDYTLSAQAPEPFDGELVTPFLLEPPEPPEERPGAVA